MMSMFGNLVSRRQQKEEFVVPDQHIRLVKGRGYVKKMKRDVVEVDMDDETVDFLLRDVTATFKPKTFDKIVLGYEIDENSNEIIVREIDVSKKIEINGKVTSVEQGIHGVIDKKYLFYWESLAEGAADIKVNDEVEATCIDCDVNGENTYTWRCISVTRVYQPTENVHTIVQNKETMNKNGIEITEKVAIHFNDINETKDFQMTVKNTSGDEFHVLESRFIGKLSDSQLKLLSPTRESTFLLKPGDMKEYKFEATSKRFGTSHEHVRIVFNGATTGKFTISRHIEVTVHDTEGRYPTMGTGLMARRNFGYTRSVLARAQNACIPGPTNDPNFVFTRFDEWSIPAYLRDNALNPAASRTAIFDALATVCPHLNETLTAENYSRVFHDLLHLEECAMENNFRIYDKISYFTRYVPVGSHLFLS